MDLSSLKREISYFVQENFKKIKKWNEISLNYELIKKHKYKQKRKSKSYNEISSKFWEIYRELNLYIIDLLFQKGKLLNKSIENKKTLSSLRLNDEDKELILEKYSELEIDKNLQEFKLNCKLDKDLYLEKIQKIQELINFIERINNENENNKKLTIFILKELKDNQTKIQSFINFYSKYYDFSRKYPRDILLKHLFYIYIYNVFNFDYIQNLNASEFKRKVDSILSCMWKTLTCNHECGNCKNVLEEKERKTFDIQKTWIITPIKVFLKLIPKKISFLLEEGKEFTTSDSLTIKISNNIFSYLTPRDENEEEKLFDINLKERHTYEHIEKYFVSYFQENSKRLQDIKNEFTKRKKERTKIKTTIFKKRVWNT